MKNCNILILGLQRSEMPTWSQAFTLQCHVLKKILPLDKEFQILISQAEQSQSSLPQFSVLISQLKQKCVFCNQSPLNSSHTPCSAIPTVHCLDGDNGQTYFHLNQVQKPDLDIKQNQSILKRYKVTMPYYFSFV